MVSCAKEPNGIDEPYVNVDRNEVNLRKNGYTNELEQPFLTVSSNVFWQIEIEGDEYIVTDPEESDNPEDSGNGSVKKWLILSSMAGHGNETRIDIAAELNNGETREAILRFYTNKGFIREVKITQAGVQDVLSLYSDGFGNTAVSSNTPVEDYEDWSYSGDGIKIPGTAGAGLNFAYSGGYMMLSSTSPAVGPGTSGGNNMFFYTENSMLVMKNIRPLREVNFSFSFFAMNDGGTFDPDLLKLEVSANNVDWTPIDYVRGSGASWEKAVAYFTLAESYENLCFRIYTTSNTGYRIDDVLFQGDPVGGDVLTLLSDSADENMTEAIPGEGATFPVRWKLTGALAASTGYGETFTNSLYINDEVGLSSLHFVPNPESSVSRANMDKLVGSTGHPYINRTIAGDYWLFKVPVETMGAGSIVNLNMITRSSDHGPKYCLLQYYDYDAAEWLDAGTVYEATEDSSVKYTHIMPPQNGVVVNATVNTSFEIPGGIDKMFLRIRFMIVGRWTTLGAEVATYFSGSHRIAGNETTAPVISVLDSSAKPSTILLETEGIEDDIIVMPGEVSEPFEFTLKTNYIWSIETADDWLTVTPDSGSSPAEGVESDQTAISVTAMSNRTESSRRGTITLKSDKTTKYIRVIQYPVTGGNSGAIFFDDFRWVEDPASSVFNVSTDSAGTDGKGISVWQTDLPAVYAANPGWTSNSSNAVYARPGFLKLGTAANAGVLISPALENIEGTKDIFVSFKTIVYRSDANTIKVSVAEGTGSVDGVNVFAIGDKWPENKYQTWYTIGVKVKGASATTKFKIEAVTSANNRFFVDDFMVVNYTGQGVGGGSVEVDDPMFDFADGNSSATIAVEGGQVVIRLAHSVPYTATISTGAETWITQATGPNPVPSPKGLPVSVSTLYYNIAQNAGNDLRAATITFTNASYPELTRIFNIKQRGLLTPAIVGLPVTWKMDDLGTVPPENAVAGTKAGNFILDNRVYSQEGTSAYVSWEKLPANVHANNVVDASGGNPRITGPFEGDYWLMTMPVEEAPANTKVRLTGALRSSAKGNKYYTIEYRTSESPAGMWYTFDDNITETVTVAGSDYTVTYTLSIAGTAAADDNQFDRQITFPEAVNNGFYYIRFVVSNNVTQDMVRINTISHNGTTRLTRSTWAVTLVE